MRRVWEFVKLSRPHFLIGGALLFALGSFSVDLVSPVAFILGQLMVTAAQLTAHYANEYADREVDAAISNRTLFSGGSGVLIRGGIQPETALRAARVTSIVAIMCAGVIVQISVVAAILGMVALGVSWTYSMPPMRLLDTGNGELATSVVVTVLVPVIGALVQGQAVPVSLMWMMAALLPLHIAMMLAFEIPDYENDKAANKTVLAVRIGPGNTNRLIIVLMMVSAALVLATALTGQLPSRSLIVVGVAALPALMTVRSMRREAYWSLTASAVATLVVMAGGFLLL